MKAEWDDAPLRVRKAPSHLPMIFSLLVVTSVAAGGVYWAERTGKVDVGLTTTINKLLNNEHPVPRQQAEQAEQANQAQIANGKPKRSKEELLAILERDGSLTVSEEEWELALSLLEEVQVYQRAPTGQTKRPQAEAEREERQLIFNDGNYVPRSDVNALDMHAPRVSTERSIQRPAEQKPYITVIEDSNRGRCVIGKPGSLECRRVRRQIYDAYSSQCKRSNGNGSVCQLARNYEPTR